MGRWSSWCHPYTARCGCPLARSSKHGHTPRDVGDALGMDNGAHTVGAYWPLVPEGVQAETPGAIRPLRVGHRARTCPGSLHLDGLYQTSEARPALRRTRPVRRRYINVTYSEATAGRAGLSIGSTAWVVVVGRVVATRHGGADEQGTDASNQLAGDLPPEAAADGIVAVHQ